MNRRLPSRYNRKVWRLRSKVVALDSLSLLMMHIVKLLRVVHVRHAGTDWRLFGLALLEYVRKGSHGTVDLALLPQKKGKISAKRGLEACVPLFFGTIHLVQNKQPVVLSSRLLLLLADDAA